MEVVMKTASVQGFLKKYNSNIKWHKNCYINIKSDTLISFLLKKVCFVPQSRPFSVSSLVPAAFMTGVI
jgi:hypothetical protein